MITFQGRTNSVLFLAQYMIRFEAHSFTHKDANCLILGAKRFITSLWGVQWLTQEIMSHHLGPVSSTRLLEHIKCGCGFVSRQLLGSFLSPLSHKN